MKSIVHDYDELLVEPLTIRANTEYRNARVRLSNSFANGWQQPPGVDNRQNFGVVRFEKGSRGGILNGMSIEGPPLEWWLERRQPGSPGLAWTWPARGLQIWNVFNAIVSNVRISSFPGEAIYLCDSQNVQILNSRAERTNSGLAIDWPRERGNKGITVDGFDVTDCWSLSTDLNAIGPSILRPGGWVGANFVYGSGLIFSTLKNIRCVGEGKGMKFTQCVDTTLSAIRTPALWMGGSGVGVPDGWTGPPTSSGWLLTDSVIGESTFGFAADKTSDPTTLTCDGVVTDEMQIQDTTFLAPRPGPLWAPWWGDAPAPGFTRFAMCNVQRGNKTRFGAGCEFIDLDGDHPEPQWIVVDPTSSFTEEPAVPRRRYTPLWHAP